MEAGVSSADFVPRKRRWVDVVVFDEGAYGGLPDSNAATNSWAATLPEGL